MPARWIVACLMMVQATAACAQMMLVEGVDPDGAGVQSATEVRDQLSPEERQRIETQSAENLARLHAAGQMPAAVPFQPPAVLLSWPVAAPTLTDPVFYG